MNLTIRNLGFALALAAAAAAPSACTGNGALPEDRSSASNPQAARSFVKSLSGSGSNVIQHVVIIIQENRTLDNLFQGFSGADTQSYGYISSGEKVQLGQIKLDTSWDLNHSFSQFLVACNGTGSYPGTNCQMNGFNKEAVGCGEPGYPACPIKYPAYAYVPHSEIEPYLTIAQQYVLGDEMFASNIDASSFVAHQYLIAAQADSTVDFPNSSEWGCEGGANTTIKTLTQQREDSGNRIQVCFNYETLGDELDAAGVSWRYYTAATPNGNGAFYSAYSAVNHIYYGSDWTKDVKSPQTKFFTDVQNGDLPIVSWITPTYQNSDHAGDRANGGPDWVASIVNAIGNSQYWDSTAIFVTWDDPGGWYDHVPPQKLDYDGLGFRVPLLLISAYAKKGHVTHVHYEHASLLRFIEDRWGLSTLSASDARANSPGTDCFNFNESPRPFQTIPSSRSKEYFMHQPPDPRPIDTE